MTVSVDAALRGFAPQLPLAIGLSGGADSTALLLACFDRWPGQVQAIHIHHGLQAAADTFEQHCAALCLRLNVPLTVQRVDGRPAPGQSPEDAARIARYKAFDAVAQCNRAVVAIKSIALAQHADDQVETLLLALSRGAGVAGLAAMPAHWQRGGIDWHAAQANELLLELAQQDLSSVGVPPQIAALQALSTARQANVLRHWLRRTHQTTPAAAQLAELQRQISACRTRGQRIHIKVGSGIVERSGTALHWYNSGGFGPTFVRKTAAPQNPVQPAP